MQKIPLIDVAPLFGDDLTARPCCTKQLGATCRDIGSAYVINIGDMLELWPGGQFVSTPHRVINRSGRERYSFPWFAVPNHRVVVEPQVAPRLDFSRAPVPVGEVSLEVWRINWSDQAPSGAGYDLGTLND